MNPLLSSAQKLYCFLLSYAPGLAGDHIWGRMSEYLVHLETYPHGRCTILLCLLKNTFTSYSCLHFYLSPNPLPQDIHPSTHSFIHRLIGFLDPFNNKLKSYILRLSGTVLGSLAIQG